MHQNRETIRNLVARIERGDRAAETELIEFYSRPVRLMLLKRTGSPPLACDFLQDTFVVILRRLRAGELNNPDGLSAFIRQTAINISIEYYRKEKRYIHQPDEIISFHATHIDNKAKKLDAKSIRALLDNALEQLSMPRDRELLRRFYLMDEDKEQICSDLKLSATHFDRVLYRAKQRMRELINQEQGLKTLLLGEVFDG